MNRPGRSSPGASRGDGRGGKSTSRPGGRQPDHNKQRRGAAAQEQQRARQTAGSDPARTAAADTLAAVSVDDAYANLVLPALLSERGITGRDAAFATELAYGTLRLQGRYDAVLAQCLRGRGLGDVDQLVLEALRLGSHQLLGMRVAPHAAVSQTVALARRRAGHGSAGFVNAVLRKVAARPLAEWLTHVREAAGDDLSDQLAATDSHPAWIVRALRTALAAHGRDPAEIAALLATNNNPPPVTLIARPGRTTVEELAAQARGEEHVRTEPGRWSPHALRLGGGDPAALPAVRTATAGVQDEGSQLVALALAAAPLASPAPSADAPDPAAPTERWLDLCAGPGGKAALLGALAAQRGHHLVANEVAPHRARLVEQATRGLGVEVRVADGRHAGEEEPGRYDRVLVDAPCTGLGSLRRRPESRWRRSPDDVADLTALQRALLTSAVRATRPGGVVAYVTCSPHVAETTAVAEDVAAATGAELIEAPTLLRSVVRDGAGLEGIGIGPTAQLWPHAHDTDAMFLALLRAPATRPAPSG